MTLYIRPARPADFHSEICASEQAMKRGAINTNEKESFNVSSTLCFFKQEIKSRKPRRKLEKSH
jgi:hypothetical protein